MGTRKNKISDKIHMNKQTLQCERSYVFFTQKGIKKVACTLPNSFPTVSNCRISDSIYLYHLIHLL